MAKIYEFKCPACGAAINFDSGEQKMVCPYCDTVLSLDSMKQYDEVLKNDVTEDPDWQEYKNTGDWSDAEKSNLRSYVCSSCGGEIICDENTAATSCPYCGNPTIIVSRLAGSLKPDLVIPFKLDKNAAKENFKQFMKGKPLLPSEFKKSAVIDKVVGLYVPFWLFNCDADADIRYKATKVRFWSDRDYNYTETSYFCLERGGNVGFDNVPADGSVKMDDKYMESIEPFDYSAAVDFQSAYLAGYLADKYDVTSDDCTPRINERIKTSTETLFAETASGYATCVPENSAVNIKTGSVKYALLPVWILNVKYKGENRQYMMNGQTGKMVGDLPSSRLKSLAYFSAAFAAAWVVATLVVQFLF